jgi:electron transfer flavoprotein alpha subunit
MNIIVLAEHVSGKFKKPAFEALVYSRELADTLGGQVSAAVLGPVNSGAFEVLAPYGVSDIIHVNSASLDTFIDQHFASALSHVVEQCQAQLVVLPQTYNGRAVAPRLAIRLKAALLSGIVGLPEKGSLGLHFRRPAYSGKAIQEVATLASKIVLTLKANSWPITQHPVALNITQLDWNPQHESKVKVLGTQQLTDKIPLTEAEVVVSAGRGLKGPENWGIIEELAQELGAATACSKPVSDVHWRPHHEHVGQTGIQIAPNVYIAIGISGAIQHLAGVNSSKTIIVINKDPEAPFFKAADYGIVGDAFEVVPALTQAIRKRSSN